MIITKQQYNTLPTRLQKWFNILPDKQMYKCDNSGESLEIFGTTDGGRKPRKNVHPTVKPIKLGAYLTMIGSREGDIVLDPFCGSGSFNISSVITKRQYIGIELDPEMCDIARRRIEYWKQNPQGPKGRKKKQPENKEQPEVEELTLF